VRLSEERIQHLAGAMIEALASRADLVRFSGDRSRAARELARFLAAELRIEDEITQEAMAKVATYSRHVAQGTTEWELLVAKHKEEIAARRGYVLG
jgi:hypothetical protein